MVKGKGGGSQGTKDRLRELKRLGLYSGDTRKEPTRYAKKLVKDFSDVLNGRAKVVTISKSALGAKAARSKAKQLAQEFSTTMRSKNNRVIVRVARPEENVYFSRSKDTLVTSYTTSGGEKIRAEYVKPNEPLPVLGDMQTYALPFSRGKDGIHYEFRATKEEILALANEYETKLKTPYRDAAKYVMIATKGDRAWKRKKRAPKTDMTNVVPFRARRGK